MELFISICIFILIGIAALSYRWQAAARRSQSRSRLRGLVRDRSKLTQEAKEAQDLLALLLQNTPSGFLITNSGLRIRYISHAAAVTFDVSPENAVGKSLIEVTRDHRISNLVEQSTFHSHRGQEETEYVLGSRSLLLRSQATKDDSGNLTGAVLTVQDVTSLRRFESVRQEFITNISHELRTPLASIRALVETIQQEAGHDTATAQDFLHRVIVEVGHLTQIVDELRTLSTVESGLPKLSREMIDLPDLAQRVANRLSAQVNRKGLQTVVDFPSGIPLISADPERIQQVLLNLLHNAIKFTAEGGTVALSAEGRDQEVEVRVSDTGVGISQDHLPRVFERLYKVDESRSSQGTGLGLAIVKHVIQSHGGRVWAESELGKGSTFGFTLPIAPR